MHVQSPLSPSTSTRTSITMPTPVSIRPGLVTRSLASVLARSSHSWPSSSLARGSTSSDLAAGSPNHTPPASPTRSSPPLDAVDLGPLPALMLPTRLTLSNSGPLSGAGGGSKHSSPLRSNCKHGLCSKF
ncbi:hypothetical protein K443DRAFT_575975 [Laccaria amethystina LaAM-08-1]|uniref:Uncharacterized protein n=1 Tax=Laccaria amethystina LaAM-08-1 TaxID=1095629 RepID=A0A0C9WRJ5_9AGAR|nr:hypothetical protein K443DRAFT_575975 [Laccaria amethystina LaAM-08-1]